MHFFSPVPVMPLIELIRGAETDDATEAYVREVAAELGKQVIVSRDRPGFIVNRVLMPFLGESMRAYEEGLATAEDIDTGARIGLNHPMGPLELADFIGLDVCLHIMEVLHEGFGDPRFAAPPVLRELVDAGHLGQKTGRGFYSLPARQMTAVKSPPAEAGAGALTDEERLLQQTVRDFARRELAPGAAERDEEERYDRDLFARMGELGLTGVPFPVEIGGAGLLVPRMDAGHGGDRLRRHGHGRLAVGPHPVASTRSSRGATRSRSARWLPDMMAGTKLGAFALTEPQAGSDASALRLRADRVTADGSDGHPRRTG